MLRIQLQALHEAPVETAEEIPPDDPLLGDVDFALGEPVAVRGRLMDSGSGRYYWHGRLRTKVAASCRRCLAAVPLEVDQDVRVVFTEEVNADDPSAYPIDPKADAVELGPMIREELILAVPEYVLCREDCRGLCAQCGKDLNEGPCACRPEPDPRWAALEALKHARPDGER